VPPNEANLAFRRIGFAGTPCTGEA